MPEGWQMTLGSSWLRRSSDARPVQLPAIDLGKLTSWLIIGALLVVVLAADLWLPVGLAIPTFYVLALLFLIALPGSTEKMVVAVACTALALLNYFFSTYSFEGLLWLPIINHGLTVAMIWIVATLGLRRSRAENALRQSEERFRALVEASSQIVWTTNADGDVVEDSPSWRAFTGQTVDQWRDSGWINAYHPDDQKRILANWRRAIAEKTPLVAQYRLRQHDGQWRWTLVRAVPLLAPNGSVRGWVGMNTDITERKQAEADTLFLLDLNECIRFAANADELIWAVAVSLGEHVHVARCGFIEIDPDRDRFTIERDYHPHAPSLVGDYTLSSFGPAVVNTGKAGQTIVICDTAHDERTTEYLESYRQLGVVAYIAAPLLRDGRIVSALLIATSEPREWGEREVALVTAVAERTWLAVEKLRLDAALRQSEAALREADRRKDEFLATLAHELRNPLSLMRNVVNLIQLPGSPEEELRWGRDIMDRQVSYLIRLTDDLFDVSRITRGKIDLQIERVEVAEVLRSAVEASRPLIDQRGHEVIVTLPEEPICLEADRMRLAQVVTNLINNAAKYMPAPGRIGLTAEREGALVVVRVKDTGIGIASENLPHVFDLFYQVDRSFARAEGGLGIGLTLVRQLVALHGGTVDVRSAGVNQGSEFILRLPARCDEVRPGETVALDAGGAKKPRARRILVVDDFPNSATTLAKLLRQRGYEVRTAEDGVEALEVAKEFHADAIVLDIAMPNLDGYDTARKIREQSWGKSTLLIALSGWGQRHDRQRTQEAGFDAHLTKPVKYQALLDLLAKLPADGRLADTGIGQQSDLAD